MNSESGYVSVEDGVRLYYERIGQGPCLIVPNGFYFLEELKSLATAHTLIVYDVRNRGLSNPITDAGKLERGILQDVEDLSILKESLRLNSFALIGHSYICLIMVLYARQFPNDVSRAIMIGAPQPDPGKTYAPPLVNNDGIIAEVFSQIQTMQNTEPIDDPVEACKRFWSVLRRMYVYKPEDADKIHWGRCDLSNERNFRTYWTDHIFPSIQNVHLNAVQLKDLKNPILLVHGDKDRSAPYGGALDWGAILPNARVLGLPDVAHAPWIEAPALFFDAARDFLGGNWPATAKKPD